MCEVGGAGWTDGRNVALKDAGIVKLIGSKLELGMRKRTSSSNLSENFSFSLSHHTQPQKQPNLRFQYYTSQPIIISCKTGTEFNTFK